MPDDKLQAEKQTPRTWESIAAENRGVSSFTSQSTSSNTPTSSSTPFSNYNNPLANAVQNQPSAPTGQSGGTYNTATGVYTSPGGQGYSMAQAPAGSTIVNDVSGLTPTILEGPYTRARDPNYNRNLENPLTPYGTPNPLAAAYQPPRETKGYTLPMQLSEKASSGTVSGMQPAFIDNPFQEPTRPKPAGFKLGDIYGQIYPLEGASGTITPSQAYEMGGGFFGLTFNPIAREKLLIAERQSSQDLQYRKEKEKRDIFMAAVSSAKGEGLIIDTKTLTPNYENIDIEKFQTSLAGKGVNLTFDKSIETKEIKGGYSYMDPLTNIGYEVTPETQTTTTYSNLLLSSQTLGRPDISLAKKIELSNIEAGRSNVGLYTSEIIGIGQTELAKGLSFYLGGEILGITGGVGYISTTLPKTAAAAKGIGTTLIAAGSAYEIGKASYNEYNINKQLGLNPIKGAIIGGVKETVGVSSLLIGASGGDFSPLQFQPVAVSGGTGESAAYSFGIVNPFGRGGVALGTYTKGGGISLGAYNPFKSLAVGSETGIEVGNQLGLQVLRNTARTLGKTPEGEIYSNLYKDIESAIKLSYKVKAPTPLLDIEGTKGIESMKEYPELQKATVGFIKGLGSGSGEFSFKGLGTAVKESAFFGKFSSSGAVGTERFFGSSTIKGSGGITRQAGDIDVNVFGKIIPKTEKFAASVKGMKGSEFLKVSEGKIEFKGTKIFEGFGQDIPPLQTKPLAYRTRTPQKGLFSSGGDVASQKLGESIIQKGSTVLTIQKTAKGNLIFSPREGQEKSIADFYKMIGRASELTTPKRSAALKSLQEDYGKIATKLNPSIDLESGTIGLGKPISTKSSFSIPSSIYSSSKFFSTPSKVSRGSSLSSSLKSSLSSSSLNSSLSSSMSSLSKSLSSSSKSSSSSVSSSLSSLSSSSSSSSSVSSLSSSSSSSSRSSSSSSSSYKFFRFTGFDIPMAIGEEGTPKRRKGKKRKKSKILPSFTAEVFNIRGSLPKGGAFGITPFQLRKLPRI